MDVKEFMNILGCDFFTGVPDSQLRALCDYLIQIQIYGTDPAHHIIAANDGNALAIASGYHLATGKIPAVYMQNSGLGNIVNPSTSLTNPKVYNIPVIFIVGWRGVLSEGRDTAFVIRKGAFTGDKVSYQNSNAMIREEIIRHIVSFSGDSPVVSTTGKTSRELFELRETHERDFLTVGSMGHASSIALGVALNKPDLKIWCIDGDGAALMHLGAMAVIGSIAPQNLVHVVINNSAH